MDRANRECGEMIGTEKSDVRLLHSKNGSFAACGFLYTSIKAYTRIRKHEGVIECGGRE